MKWIEAITVRSFAKFTPQMLEQLAGQLAESNTDGRLPEIRIYHHPDVETDFCIHIHWETDRPGPAETPLGKQLSYAMKGLGFVNHSVWVETGEAKSDMAKKAEPAVPGADREADQKVDGDIL